MPSKQPKELWKHSSLCPATWSSFLFVRRKLLFSGWWIRPRYSGADKAKEKRTALSAVRFSFALSEFSKWAIPLSKSPVSEIFPKNQKRRRQDVGSLSRNPVCTQEQTGSRTSMSEKTAKRNEDNRFLHFHVANFFKFMATNLSFTQFVTWAKPLYCV